MLTAFFRTIILYLLLLVGIRLTGKRQIGQLEPIELVLMMLLSDLASVPMQDFGIPLLNGALPIITLLALTTLMSYISMRCIRFRSLVCGEPALIIREGKIVESAMRHNRLTLDELLEELRIQGVADLTTVKYAVLETSGQISVLLRADQQPATPAQMAIAVEDDVFLPAIIINDGRILGENLRKMGLNEEWLRKRLDEQKIKRAEEVFLLTVDHGGNVTCCRKEVAQ